MIQNAQITIEQFDNGITLKWEDLGGATDSMAIVATDMDKERVIGKNIYDEIKCVMDGSLCNKVKMTIKYEPINEE